MDPMGRYLLARPVNGDSAWVVAIATQTLVGTVGTAWRNDLPTVAVDGMIGVARGDDVVFVDPNSGKTVREVTGGAADIWFFALWNGFRPRSRELDTPVSFATRDSSPRDPPPPDTSPVAPEREPRDTAPPPPVAPPAPAQPVSPPVVRDAWTVSFAAVLSEARAKEIAQTIEVEGQRPRVVAAQTAGTTVYRVVFGPYTTKMDAERIGRASKHNYWVYEGIP
jgi:cell division septation protein DedD